MSQKNQTQPVKTLKGINKDLTEVWNILNSKKNNLIDEIEAIESLLNIIEDRNNMIKSNKLFI